MSRRLEKETLWRQLKIKTQESTSGSSLETHTHTLTPLLRFRILQKLENKIIATLLNVELSPSMKLDTD
jgi:cell shape-determining protein MreC